MLLSCSNQI